MGDNLVQKVSERWGETAMINIVFKKENPVNKF